MRHLRRWVRIALMILIPIFIVSCVLIQRRPTDVTLTLWVYDEDYIEVFSDLGKQFEKETDISLKVSYMEEYHDGREPEGAPDYTGADLIFVDSYLLPSMIEDDIAVPITLGYKQDSFLPNALDAFTYQGKLYGLPILVFHIGFFRNTNLVPNAPSTWDEVIEIGTQLMQDGLVERAISLPDLTYHCYPIYTTYGGYLFGRDANGDFITNDIRIDNEGMVAGLSLIQDLVETGLVEVNIQSEVDNNIAAHQQFESGESAFIITGPWSVNSIRAAGIPYEISAFPAAEEGGEPGYPIMSAWGIVIKDNHDIMVQDAQILFVDFMAREESFSEFVEAMSRVAYGPDGLYNWVPLVAWKSIYEHNSDPNYAGFNEAGINALPYPTEIGYAWDPWTNAANQVVSGELSPEEALNIAADEIRGKIEENQ